MGFPKLGRALRPYLQVTSLSGKNVVVDGPALVHLIWERCVRDQPAAGAVLGQMPYAVLGQNVINWLEDLRRNNVQV